MELLKNSVSPDEDPDDEVMEGDAGDCFDNLVRVHTKFCGNTVANKVCGSSFPNKVYKCRLKCSKLCKSWNSSILVQIRQLCKSCKYLKIMQFSKITNLFGFVLFKKGIPIHIPRKWTYRKINIKELSLFYLDFYIQRTEQIFLQLILILICNIF